MHELIAYRGMKKLDDSKIYVNQDDILKYELKNITDLYDRFHKLVANTTGKVYFLVDTIDWSNDEMLTNATSYSDNAVAEVSTQLFSVIRRAFLKSRFGLGTYLSTRIRHGVFEGELRSCLERLNLVYKTAGFNMCLQCIGNTSSILMKTSLANSMTVLFRSLVPSML